MPLILGTNSIKDTGYDVANSLRFNNDDSPQLHKTPGGAGNQDAWTLSMWVKRSSVAQSGTQSLYGVYADGNNQETLAFDSGGNVDKLYWQFYQSGGVVGQLTTTRLFRDVSAWYNIVVSYDSANGTAGNRMRMWINGTEETGFDTDTNPSSGLNSQWNGTTKHQIGCINTTNYFDGYMAEVVSLDGTAVTDATLFGEFDEDSAIWKPKDVSGLTGGTNGFYLDFEDSSNLGNDVFGGTDLTEVNLAATDQSTDTCTNNFATLNPLYNAYVDPTFSEGNLKITQSSGWSGAKATMGVSTGKWYWEIKLTGTMSSHQHGVQQENVNESAQDPQNITGSTVFYNHDGGEMRTDGTATTADYGTFSSGDIMGLALDMDAGSYGQITIYKNGSAIVSDFNLASSSTTVMPFLCIDNSTVECNFGSPPYAISSGNADGNGYGNFEYSVPSGYYSLCTKNLAEFG